MLRRRPTGRALLREEGSLSTCGGSQSSYLPPPPTRGPNIHMYVCLRCSTGKGFNQRAPGPPLFSCFCFLPPPRHLSDPGPPTLREIKNARPGAGRAHHHLRARRRRRLGAAQRAVRPSRAREGRAPQPRARVSVSDALRQRASPAHGLSGEGAETPRGDLPLRACLVVPARRAFVRRSSADQ
jgi:hypothetical protein